MKLDICIVGAMKCGTTSLHETLKKHPNICASKNKEPSFFCKKAPSKNECEVYFENFSHKEPSQKTLESSTDYAKIPKYTETAQRLFAHNPLMKIIYLKRDPLIRIISHYEHKKNRKEENLDFSKALFSNPNYINFSLYELQIAEYYQYFPKNHILELSYEEIYYQNFNYKKIYDFLNIENRIEETVYHNTTKNYKKTPSRLSYFFQTHFFVKTRKKISDAIRKKKYFTTNDRKKLETLLKEPKLLSAKDLAG